VSDARTPEESKGWRRRLALLSIAALLALVVAEVGVRIVKPYPIDYPLYPGDVEEIAELRGTTRLDPQLGWRFEPNAVVQETGPDFSVAYQCDAEGFRAVRERADARQRVLFVGDSFTFGVGVEPQETFVERFADLAPGVQPENIGMAGFAVDQMWRALAHEFDARRPDVVIVSFVTDDLTRSMTAYRYRNGWMRKPTYQLEGGVLVEQTEANAPGSWTRFFERKFALAEVYRRAARSFGLRQGLGERFELNLRLFEAMRDYCRERGAKFLVVHLPQRGAWRPLESYAAEFEQSDTAYLDLGAAFVDSPNELYFPKDPHFNARGHEFVAQALHAHCEQRGWLAPSAK